MFDFNTLTVGEADFIEGLANKPLAKFTEDDFLYFKVQAALVTIIKRRNGEPKYLLNDAMALSAEAMSEYLSANLPQPEEDEEIEGKDESSEKSETET